MTLEALSLPDRYIDCIYPIANSCNDSGDYQLHTFGCRGLQNCSDYHDPASAHNTTLPTITISSQKCSDSANEAANVIDGGDDAFKLGAWIVEVGAKRRQANHGPEDALVIAEKLPACQSALSM